jgi:hypothetical protein
MSLTVPRAGTEPFADVDPEAVPAAPRFLFEVARSRFLLRPARRERRRVPRFFLAAEVLARPLALDGGPAGAAFRGVIIDLSNDGLRIIHVERVTAPLLVVRLGLWDDAIEFVARMSRAVRIGSHFELAGRFLAAETGADVRPAEAP